jgi:hypothetical protein
MARLLKVPLLLSATAGGAYAVTSPLLPEMLVEAATAAEAVAAVPDALRSVYELYQHLRKPFPAVQCLDPEGRPVSFEGILVLA